jgi:hypothetical protein
MNQRDRSNLEFLMRYDHKTKEWFRTATPDDLEYAWELLEAHGRELAAEREELIIEEQLEKMEEHYPESLQLLKNFI